MRDGVWILILWPCAVILGVLVEQLIRTIKLIRRDIQQKRDDKAQKELMYGWHRIIARWNYDCITDPWHWDEDWS